MQPSKPNANGVIEAGTREVLATRGRSFAAANFALCEDGLYRYGLDLMYSTGGFGFPIYAEGRAYSTLDAARTAALEQLLREWHTPFPSDADSVRTELADMRRQIEERLRQPSLF